MTAARVFALFIINKDRRNASKVHGFRLMPKVNLCPGHERHVLYRKLFDKEDKWPVMPGY
jgi:hypothetical protein